MKIAIIIVTYNAMPWIDHCLQSTGDYPVLVVDNASTDQTVSHIQSNYSKVTLLPQNKNLGFGKGNNVGISYALKQGAEHVFLLNQDAYLVGNCLDILIKKQQEQPEYAVLSSIHLNGSGDAIDNNFGNYINYQKAPELISDLLAGKEEGIYEIPFVNAAGWLISRKCLETVGGFDPIFFHYGEDDNYCQRVYFHGLKVGVLPHTFFCHDREARKLYTVEKYSEEYFGLLERRYKLTYANINEDTEAHLEKEIKRLKSVLAKERLKLRWVSASNIKKQLELVLLIKEPILKSRAINKRKGRHYL